MKLQPTTTLLASFSFQFLPRLIKNPIRTSPDTQYDVPGVTTARPQSRDLPTRYKNGILRISSVPDPSGLRLEGSILFLLCPPLLCVPLEDACLIPCLGDAIPVASKPLIDSMHTMSNLS